jgi:flagellin-like hook-associated protein FlgL
MTDQELTPFPEIDRLTNMLDEAQVHHAQELYRIKQEEQGKIDQSQYNAKRKQSAELHEEISKALTASIEQTKEQTRRTLADSLLRPDSRAEEDMRHLRAMVDLVESAGKDITKIEELIHRALKYQDRTLARLLVRTHCGTKDRKTMHQALSTVDPAIKATWDFESKHGAYVKQANEVWAGWLTPEQAKEVWVDGIPGRTKSPFIRRKP